LRTPAQIRAYQRNLRLRPHAPSAGRGRLQRQIRRAFIARGNEASGSDIYRWCKRWQAREFGQWERWSIVRVLRQIAEPIGRADTIGRPAMFQMMGVFAEFERSMIRERVHAGIARAKASGKHCGRPFIDTKLEGASVPLWLHLTGRVCTRSPSSSALVRARCSGLRRRRDRPPRRRWLLLDYPWGLLAFVAIAAVHTARAMRRPRSVGVI
jgi:hypothetical protein